jgi:hypothetical protein
MWDAFVDAWAIAAGAVPAPPHASGELQQAASILLGLAETGAMERLDGAQTTRLTAIGADRWAGLRAMPAGREARDAVFRLIFGARKRVEGELGLPAGSLPRSRTTPPDAPASRPAATARQLIAWARSRDLETEVVGGGLFAGEDLATWDPIALAGLDAELATTALDLRIVFRGHSPVLHVPAGRDTPWDVASCRTPRSQCETGCPLFGRPVCAKYQVGIGWIR